MINYHIPLNAGCQYHIFSRAIGSEKLFRQESDYSYFMTLVEKHLSCVVDFYCYCLLPNHFHFLILSKPENEIRKNFEEMKSSVVCHALSTPKYIIQQFSNLLNSYAKVYNRLYKRKGGLFIDCMRRVEIKNESQFISTVFYIHKNPVHHGYCEKIEDWPRSSYPIILLDQGTTLLKKEVLQAFYGRDRFIQFHNQAIDLKLPQNPDDFL